MLRSIREEAAVTQALKAAALIYPRLWDAYEALSWLLARRPMHGEQVSTPNNVYYIHKQAAGGFGVPGFLIVYTMSDNEITIHSLKII